MIFTPEEEVGEEKGRQKSPKEISRTIEHIISRKQGQNIKRIESIKKSWPLKVCLIALTKSFCSLT